MFFNKKNQDKVEKEFKSGIYLTGNGISKLLNIHPCTFLNHASEYESISKIIWRGRKMYHLQEIIERSMPSTKKSEIDRMAFEFIIKNQKLIKLIV